MQCSMDGNDSIDDFDCSVFNGEYVTGDVDSGYLSKLESMRNDEAQSGRRAAQEEGAMVGLHNDI
jgi:amidophosphoribosyltransferase